MQMIYNQNKVRHSLYFDLIEQLNINKIALICNRLSIYLSIKK